MSNWKQNILVALKGFAMGSANVVPGVSGGTICLITGIYDRVIECIKSINITNLRLFFKGKFKDFWKAIDGNFLLWLGIGLVASILSLAKLITWLLDAYPTMVWAFFFGLVLASVYPLVKDIENWNWKTVLSLAVGTGIGLYITLAAPADGTVQTVQANPALWYIFLCGAIAICTMILPGISGSFVLILLGTYHYIMGALDVTSPKWTVIAVFGIGAVIGIVAFSHLLSYALKKFRSGTMALLTGFMLGSVAMIWPWKEKPETLTPTGETIITFGRNTAPDQYIWQAVLLFAVGFALVFALDRLSGKKSG